ncbi:hypothetical protein ABH926_008897 [Catenulispora sp. GP43]
MRQIIAGSCDSGRDDLRRASASGGYNPGGYNPSDLAMMVFITSLVPP